MRRVPWVALGVLLATLATWASSYLQPISALLPGCAFKRLTGFACATCGLTRCILALGRWEWAEAFHWHPVAAAAAVLLPVAVAWDLRRAWRGHPYPGLPDSGAVRMSVWALLLGTWLLQVWRGI